MTFLALDLFPASSNSALFKQIYSRRISIKYLQNSDVNNVYLVRVRLSGHEPCIGCSGTSVPLGGIAAVDGSYGGEECV